MQPNVIMILIDDLGWMDLSCQGSSFYETPHIDGSGLAGDGGVAASGGAGAHAVSAPVGKWP